MYLLRIQHDDGCTCVRAELRHEQMIDDEGVEGLWTLMLPFVKDIDNLLAQFAGTIKEAFNILYGFINPNNFQNLLGGATYRCSNFLVLKFICLEIMSCPKFNF